MCIGSGPSLTVEDCDRAATVADWMVACNDSFRAATWAHAIYAGDFAWWDKHYREVPERLERWTCSESAAQRFRLHYHRCSHGLWNSGQRAIQLAIAKGYQRILLLGYDCDVSRGTHWHGDHAGKNPDATRARQWQDQFASIERGSVDIINCSRETALRAFPIMTLEAAIAL